MLMRLTYFMSARGTRLWHCFAYLFACHTDTVHQDLFDLLIADHFSYSLCLTHSLSLSFCLTGFEH